MLFSFSLRSGFLPVHLWDISVSVAGSGTHSPLPDTRDFSDLCKQPQFDRCTAPVTHSSWTCTLECTVLNNWSKLYVFHIQLEEEITPLNSLYQAASVRKIFSMLEMFTAPQAEIINERLQLSHVIMSTLWWSTSCWCSLVWFFWGVFGINSVFLLE